MSKENQNAILQRRHFRLKLYEYCFRILYGNVNFPLREYSDVKFVERSQSLQNQLNEDETSPKRVSSTFSLIDKDTYFIRKLNKQLALLLRQSRRHSKCRKKASSAQVEEDPSNEGNWKDSELENLKNSKYKYPITEKAKHHSSCLRLADLTQQLAINIHESRRYAKRQRKTSNIDLKVYKDMWIEDYRSKQENWKDSELENLKKSKYKYPITEKIKRNSSSLSLTESTQQLKHNSIRQRKDSNAQIERRNQSNEEARQVPKFEYLKKPKYSYPIVEKTRHSKRSSIKSIDRKSKEDSSNTPNEVRKFNYLRKSSYKYPTPIKLKKSKETQLKATQRKIIDNPKNFSKSFSSLPIINRRKTEMDYEIEADREALKQFVQDEVVENSKTPTDTQRGWISDKTDNDEDSDGKDNEVNFQRSWSAWTLEKAKLLDWDPDLDAQPVWPQDKSIRQKYFKDASIKESKEIERKRKLAIENSPILAQVRENQVMKMEEKVVKPVEKTEKIEEKEVKPEKSKFSLFAQIKNTLQNVPEKIKGILSFGNEASKQPNSAIEIKSDTKDEISQVLSINPSSSIVHNKTVQKFSPKQSSLHEHNTKVETVLGNVLFSKPADPIPEVKNENLIKIPTKIAKTATKSRQPISWRTIQTDKLPKIKTTNSSSLSTQQNSKITRLPPIPRQTDIFDPIGNPYRSAGRKYSPIPVGGWPKAHSFNPEVGRCKIIDYIEQNWKYKKQLSYRVEHFHSVQLVNNKQRFKYKVCWNSTKAPGQEGTVYFNVDVSRLDPLEPIKLSYKFQGQNKLHRAQFSPTALPFRKRWLRSMEEGYPLP